MTARDPGGREHEVSVERYRGLADGGPWFIAHCSCGKYQSGKHAYPGHAERAGLEHARAKTQEATDE